MEKKSGGIKTVCIHLGLVLLASFLFACSFPNLLFENGLPFIAWFAYIPVLVLIRKSSFLSCIGWGAVYGYAAYGLFNYWLSVFHPLAGIIVDGIYLVYMTVLFALLKFADLSYPRYSYLVQWVIFLAYEFLRTCGFLGYSYGITGYSQWRVIPLIQIAGITGVWGVSALVTLPSFWLAQAVRDWRTESGFGGIGRALSSFFRKEKISAVLWAAAVAVALVFGISSGGDFFFFFKARIALVQHNTDPWAPSKAVSSWQANEEYKKDLAILKRLSEQALAEEPKPQLVVWPETAFVPRIYWHETYRDDPSSWIIVRELLDYLALTDVPFLIGNDDARKDPSKNPDASEQFRIDYNAALLFENGKVSETYRKLHLVPFTEHFPYGKQLPFIYRALENADTHFWEKGEEFTVFSVPGFAFSTPICFEDTFGYLSRNFVSRGADVLVNISNDAWSKSLPAQNQHLSMAVFRAVENYRPLVRSTVSGQTCAVDPRGKVIALARPFTEAWITVEVPLVKGNTFYTLHGDYLGFVFSFAAALLLLFAAVSGIIRKVRQEGNYGHA